MHARSTAGPGRPGNRPAGGGRRVRAVLCLLALVAPAAAGVPAAVAADEEPPAATVTATPSPAEPVEAPTPEPTQAETTPPSPPPEPAPVETPAPVKTPEPVETPEAVAPPPVPVVAATNVSVVFQVVWQLQRGCETYCHGTSQTQSSTQAAKTEQQARAEGDGGAAKASNESRVVQFSWQRQVGCRTHCFGTSLTQAASQAADTKQVAEAVGSLAALAGNLAETLQFVWQAQEGCQAECHGVSESQSVSQGAATTQAASPLAERIGVLPGWLVALAANVGATIQEITQIQEALCASHCVGDAQVQEAVQLAIVTQLAVAAREEDAPAVEDAPAPVAEPEAAPPAPLAAVAPPATAGPSKPAIAPPATAGPPKPAAEPLRAGPANRVSHAGTAATAARLASPVLAGQALVVEPTAAPPRKRVAARAPHNGFITGERSLSEPVRIHVPAAALGGRDVAIALNAALLLALAVSLIIGVRHYQEYERTTHQ